MRRLVLAALALLARRAALAALPAELELDSGVASGTTGAPS
jgi:hypothetical protein